MRVPVLVATLVVSFAAPAAAQTWDCGKLPSCDGGPVVIRPLDRGPTTWLDAIDGDVCSETAAAWFASEPLAAATATLRAARGDRAATARAFADAASCATRSTAVLTALSQPDLTVDVVADAFTTAAPLDGRCVGADLAETFACASALAESGALDSDGAVDLAAGAILHGHVDDVAFARLVRADAARAAAALTRANDAFAAVHLTIGTHIDAGTDLTIIDTDALDAAAASDPLVASAAMSRGAPVLSARHRAELDHVGTYNFAGTTWALGLTQGSQRSGEARTTRNRGKNVSADHIGAYNFMVEISGVAAGLTENPDSDCNGAWCLYDRAAALVRSGPADADVLLAVAPRPTGFGATSTEIVAFKQGNDTIVRVSGVGWAFPPSVRPEIDDEVVLGLFSAPTTDLSFTLDSDTSTALFGELADDLAPGETITVSLPTADLAAGLSDVDAWRLFDVSPGSGLLGGR